MGRRRLAWQGNVLILRNSCPLLRRPSVFPDESRSEAGEQIGSTPGSRNYRFLRALVGCGSDNYGGRWACGVTRDHILTKEIPHEAAHPGRMGRDHATRPRIAPNP